MGSVELPSGVEQFGRRLPVAHGGDAVFPHVGPTGTDEHQVFRLRFAFQGADSFVGEGGMETQLWMPLQEPIGDGLVNPGVDAGNDLTDADRRDVERSGDVELFPVADDDETVDVEVAAGGDFEA